MDTLIRNPAEVESAFRLTIAKYPQQARMPVPMPTSDNTGGFGKLAQIRWRLPQSISMADASSYRKCCA